MTKHLMRWTDKDKKWASWNLQSPNFDPKASSMEVVIEQQEIAFYAYYNKKHPVTGEPMNVDRAALCCFPMEDWDEFKAFIDTEILRQTAQGLEDM